MAARKKTLKKTEFESFENCFPKTSQTASTWAAWFQNDHPLHLELGCGKAEFSYALSSLFPEKNYVGVDLKPDRLWKPAKDALAEGRKNIALVCGNLLHLDQYVAENEADEIWITFPDPFPKKRHIKHRMVNPPFLAQYRKVLAPEGFLHFKTDNLELFQYTLEVWARQPGLHFHEICFDLHGENALPDHYKLLTTYERAFLEMGKKINYTCISFS